MTSPGVEVRPIRLLEGGSEVNEVFFTDVKVPAANLVGDENRGWTCAKYLLTYERTNIAGTGLSMAALAQLSRPLHESRVTAGRLRMTRCSPHAWHALKSNSKTCGSPTCASLPR